MSGTLGFHGYDRVRVVIKRAVLGFHARNIIVRVKDSTSRAAIVRYHSTGTCASVGIAGSYFADNVLRIFQFHGMSIQYNHRNISI